MACGATPDTAAGIAFRTGQMRIAGAAYPAELVMRRLAFGAESAFLDGAGEIDRARYVDSLISHGAIISRSCFPWKGMSRAV